MTVELGIIHLMALETAPVPFIEIAAQAGAGAVSLFVNRMGPDSNFPVVTREDSRAVQQALRDHGLRVGNVDPFVLSPTTEVSQFQSALELAGELGAQGITVLLFDKDEARVVDHLGQLCEAARPYGLTAGIEFMGLTPGWNSLADTVALIEQVDRPNLGVVLDVLHLVRTGGTVAQVAALDPSHISHVQLCDGAHLDVTRDYAVEAASDRAAPGDGVFPLVEFLQALPAGVRMELEVPQPGPRPALERITDTVTKARTVLDAAGF